MKKRLLCALAVIMVAMGFSAFNAKSVFAGTKHIQKITIVQNNVGQCNGPQHLKASTPSGWLKELAAEGVKDDAAKIASHYGFVPMDSSFDAWVKASTMVIALPFPVTAQDYWCPNGTHTMIKWKMTTHAAGWPAGIILPKNLSRADVRSIPTKGFHAQRVTVTIFYMPSCGNVWIKRVVTLTLYIRNVPSTPPAKPKVCTDNTAGNYGKPLPCLYPKPQPRPTFTGEICKQVAAAGYSGLKMLYTIQITHDGVLQPTFMQEVKVNDCDGIIVPVGGLAQFHTGDSGQICENQARAGSFGLTAVNGIWCIPFTVGNSNFRLTFYNQPVSQPTPPTPQPPTPTPPTPVTMSLQCITHHDVYSGDTVDLEILAKNSDGSQPTLTPGDIQIWADEGNMVSGTLHTYSDSSGVYWVQQWHAPQTTVTHDIAWHASVRGVTCNGTMTDQPQNTGP